MSAILAGIASRLHAVPTRVLHTDEFMEWLRISEAFIDTDTVCWGRHFPFPGEESRHQVLVSPG